MTPSKIRTIRGMHDMFGARAELFCLVKDIALSLAERFGFSYLEIPILEFLEVFERSAGETSDIINKEIYTFIDRSEEKLALRPEFTAGIMRAVISNNISDSLPAKFYSCGPIFRYDRPQRGRYRQFNQLNFEIIGINSPQIDADLIQLGAQLIQNLKIDNIRLEINSLGTLDCRKKFEEHLVDYLMNFESQLSPDSQARLRKKPLRILDSKHPNDQEILQNAPLLSDFYDQESSDFWNLLRRALDSINIEYFHNPKLVRGLDYYDHTVFEFSSSELGAQGTVLGGGRYNGLAENFGHTKIPCVGFAAGIERLMEVAKISPLKKPRVCVLLLDVDYIEIGFRILGIVRSKISAELLIPEFGRSTSNLLKKLLEKADKQNFSFAIIVGENEVKSGQFLLKDLGNSLQKTSDLENILGDLLILIQNKDQI